mmetsp:Transcript_9160/g.31620  ORF Transcript_9160/g.31620 Transcript_9160/m.31620 type:complete len:253 (-) Transcript_9160:1144-1902(-)
MVLSRIQVYQNRPPRPRGWPWVVVLKGKVRQGPARSVPDVDHLAAPRPRDQRGFLLADIHGGGSPAPPPLLAGRPYRHQEQHVMAPDAVPLRPDICPAKISQIDGNLAQDAPRPVLAQCRRVDPLDRETCDRGGHPRPPREPQVAFVPKVSAHPRRGVKHLLPDLRGRLQLEQLEGPHKVVPHRKELQVHPGEAGAQKGPSSSPPGGLGSLPAARDCQVTLRGVQGEPLEHLRPGQRHSHVLQKASLQTAPG